MIERYRWANSVLLSSFSRHYGFLIEPGVHSATGMLSQFVDSKRPVDRSMGFARFIWNFHDQDGVAWRYIVLLRPQDWLPLRQWQLRPIDRAWEGQNPVLFPRSFESHHIRPIAKHLGTDEPESLYWSFRYKLVEPSDFFTIQMGAHRTRMNDLHKPVGLWEYLLPFSHWLWRPGTRYTETAVEPQALPYCDIERVQPPKGHVGAYQIRGLDRSPVVVTPRADV